MIPISDSAPKPKLPFITILLITANTAVFVYQHYSGVVDGSQLYFRLGSIPYEITRLTDIGPTAGVPIPLTLMTGIFLHGGWIHLMGNMLFLWIFGDNVEGRVGRVHYLIFFLAGGVLATLVQVIANPSSRIPIVGASGAVAAVMASYLVFFPTAKVKTLLFWFVFFQVVDLPAFVFLVYWIGVQLLIVFSRGDTGTTGVAWFAHLGGFTAGFAFALVHRVKRRRPKKKK